MWENSTSAWEPGMLLPIWVDNTHLQGPMVWLSIMQLCVHVMHWRMENFHFSCFIHVINRCIGENTWWGCIPNTYCPLGLGFVVLVSGVCCLKCFHIIWFLAKAQETSFSEERLVLLVLVTYLRCIFRVKEYLFQSGVLYLKKRDLIMSRFQQWIFIISNQFSDWTVQSSVS